MYNRAEKAFKELRLGDFWHHFKDLNHGQQLALSSQCCVYHDTHRIKPSALALLRERIGADWGVSKHHPEDDDAERLKALTSIEHKKNPRVTRDKSVRELLRGFDAQALLERAAKGTKVLDLIQQARK